VRNWRKKAARGSKNCSRLLTSFSTSACTYLPPISLSAHIILLKLIRSAMFACRAPSLARRLTQQPLPSFLPFPHSAHPGPSSPAGPLVPAASFIPTVPLQRSQTPRMSTVVEAKSVGGSPPLRGRTCTYRRWRRRPAVARGDSSRSSDFITILLPLLLPSPRRTHTQLPPILSCPPPGTGA
jgi:hypothetical protein